jgi:hypothetical protein
VVLTASSSHRHLDDLHDHEDEGDRQVALQGEEAYLAPAAVIVLLARRRKYAEDSCPLKPAPSRPTTTSVVS